MKRRILAGAAALGATLVISGGAAVAAVSWLPQDPSTRYTGPARNTVYACVNASSRQMRYPTGHGCKSNEFRIEIVGKVGPTGPRGPMGPQGEKGEKGDQGEVGPVSTVSPSPIPGPSGPQGEIGPTGPAGPRGPRGETGPTGPAGVSATYPAQLVCTGDVELATDPSEAAKADLNCRVMDE